MAKIDLGGKLAETRARIAAEGQDAADPTVPLYARLTRKEARVREDQYAALTALARTLMRRRRLKVERITENTLIRVAIDLLLAHQDELRGSDEDELRKSVSPQLSKSGTREVPNSMSAAHTRTEVSNSRRAGVSASDPAARELPSPQPPDSQSPTLTNPRRLMFADSGPSSHPAAQPYAFPSDGAGGIGASR
ncbi:hypothetical protein [Microbacterium candidum]|uniref:Uncharacterized protein n=1 Tax=Microbacterium candidum TaxID=3041922 RepID=A0ABT7MVV7_9MICO|nr:hypothetical protein [Microbacterium sp. ASV49]MDL9978584.1 hypothetical protein [Microbacterium sp. ASV49]